jgi:hypothetical protein
MSIDPRIKKAFKVISTAFDDEHNYYNSIQIETEKILEEAYCKELNKTLDKMLVEPTLSEKIEAIDKYCEQFERRIMLGHSNDSQGHSDFYPRKTLLEAIDAFYEDIK